jgi:Domain of unknown function (DUF3854)/Protein of unknown function (DUF3631)
LTTDDVSSPAAVSTTGDISSPAAGSITGDVSSPAAGSITGDVSSPAAGSSTGDVSSPAAGSSARDTATRAAEAASRLSLHQEALEDLRRSGLSDATIAEAGLYTPAPGDLPRLLSARLAAQVRHVLVLPYDGASSGGLWRREDEFVRCKLFPPVSDGHGHTIRYYQRAGTPPRLYIPARARAALADPRVPLLITEGEKKALKANQDGLPCVGLGGLWNWRHERRPIAELDRIDWYGRDALVVPDSDVWTRADLLQPVYALGRELESRGAVIGVLKLPPGPEGSKVGLDDYLCAHCAAELDGLPRLRLKHTFFSRTAIWWKEWVIQKDEPRTDCEPTVLELLGRPQTVRVLHPAQEVRDGELWYGLTADRPPRAERALIMVSSARQAYLADRLPENIALRHTDPGPSTVSREAAVRWLGGAETGSVGKALDDLADFFLRYVVLRERRTAQWVAAWALGTWSYRAFRIFPYLSIRSAEKRCGKSRMLGLLQRVCFNASPVTAHPTEAQLYRSAARTGGAQLFDEMESLRGDKDRFDALITVLNVGFERGGVVTRLEKRGDRFVEELYEVYAPRVLAGIAGLKDTLEDRALTLVMLRRRKSELVARIGRATDADAQGLRDQCALACLSRIGDIIEAYDLALTALEREGIDDRAVDLWSPLLAIAFVADSEDTGNRSRDILDAARDLAAVRDADAEAGTAARLIEALQVIREREGEAVAPAGLLEALRALPGWDWVKSSRRLAGLLNPLGVVRQQIRDGDRRRWCYVLSAEQLADLRARYGGAADSEERPDGPARATFSGSNPVTSGDNGDNGDNPHE